MEQKQPTVTIDSEPDLPFAGISDSLGGEETSTVAPRPLIIHLNPELAKVPTHYPRYHHSSHKHRLFCIFGQGFKCDNYACGRSIAMFESRFTCPRCNFDLCGQCFALEPRACDRVPLSPSDVNIRDQVFLSPLFQTVTRDDDSQDRTAVATPANLDHPPAATIVPVGAGSDSETSDSDSDSENQNQNRDRNQNRDHNQNQNQNRDRNQNRGRNQNRNPNQPPIPRIRQVPQAPRRVANPNRQEFIPLEIVPIRMQVLH